MANVNFNVPGGLKGKPARMMVGLVGGSLLLMIFFGSCTTYIPPNQVGIKESRFLPPTGILSGEMPGGKIKFLLPGQTIHLFPKDIQVLDLTGDARETGHERGDHPNHRIEPAVQINTSDGSQVMIDATVIYRIENADLVVTQAGPGRLFENNAVIPKTISALKKNLGEMVAEDFYDVHKREPKQRAAQIQIAAELKEKGILVDHVLIRQYYYNPAYQAQIEEKKIQDQLKFTRVSEAEAAKGLAKLQEIVATGKATVAIEGQRGQAEITKIRAEADAYKRKRMAEADLQVQLATAKGTELENSAYEGGGSENLVGMQMAEVYKGIEVIVIPAGGKGGVNPLDLEQALKLFDVK
jgi:regulator of protease activity HflC (stomatin/prohibitin superfamily)